MKEEGRRQNAKCRGVGAYGLCRQCLGHLLSAIGYSQGAAPSARKLPIANRKRPIWLGTVLLFLLLAGVALAEQRFPPPDFEGGHKLPTTMTPAARAVLLQYLDVAVLGAALGLASWLVYKRRSRKGLMALSIFSLLYFGFWKKGCVCAIGSLAECRARALRPRLCRAAGGDCFLRAAAGCSRCSRGGPSVPRSARMARCRIWCCSSR